jgi:hypothetical protein
MTKINIGFLVALVLGLINIRKKINNIITEKEGVSTYRLPCVSAGAKTLFFSKAGTALACKKNVTK